MPNPKPHPCRGVWWYQIQHGKEKTCFANRWKKPQQMMHRASLSHQQFDASQSINMIDMIYFPYFPIGSMYAIYGDLDHQYTPFMLASIYHTWILWIYKVYFRMVMAPTIIYLWCPRFVTSEIPTLNHTLLVGGWATPLKNMSSSIGMMTFPIDGKIKNGN